MIQDQNTTTFQDFGLHPSIMQALQELKFVTPSPIQQQAIPHVMTGRDLIGQAQTGTGKTAAFGLPALHYIQKNPGAQLLVMTPTRELAKQVSDEMYRFGKHLGIHTAIICGGKSAKHQTEALRRGVQVIVATPGRLLDLLQSGQLPNFKPALVVLDEADEMLDMGFLEDIQSIFTFLPKERQTLLFSATMPAPIQRLAKEILDQPLFIGITRQETTNQDIEQVYYMLRDDERDHAIARLIDSENPTKAIIFCKTKKDVDRLENLLAISGHPVRKLHGDMEQNQREEVIRQFRSEHVRLLVATDVAARGLSISEISHVFNYHLPFDPSCYVHRIGRTGRAGNKGVAITFVTSREWRDFQRYEKVLGTKIARGNIPTLEEVKTIKQRQLASKIMEQPDHQEVQDVLRFMTDVDSKTMNTKLLSLLLSQQVTIGPDRLGLEPLSDGDRSERSGGRDRPRRGSSYGGGESRGGGRGDRDRRFSKGNSFSGKKPQSSRTHHSKPKTWASA